MISGLSILTKNFVGKAIIVLVIVFLWNAIGRNLQKRTAPAPATSRERVAYILGGIMQTTVLTAVLLSIALVLISGVIENPTNFRYAGF